METVYSVQVAPIYLGATLDLYILPISGAQVVLGI